MKDVIPYIKEALDSVNKFSSNLFYARIPFCLMSGYEIYNHDLYGSLAKFDIGKKGGYIINNSFLDTLFTKKQDCTLCIHNNYCYGIMKGYAKMFGLNEFTAVRK